MGGYEIIAFVHTRHSSIFCVSILFLHGVVADIYERKGWGMYYSSAASSFSTSYIIGYFIGACIWGVIWGIATNAIIHNKGYDENWFWWGFFFSIIAVIVAATKPQNTHSYNSYDSNSSGSSIGYNYNYTPSPSSIPQGSWICKCGRVNPSYMGTCSCGWSKYEVEEIERKAKQKQEEEQAKAEEEKSAKEAEKVAEVAAKAAKEANASEATKEHQEISNAAAIKEYKKLLDEGIITQEEFDAKKKQLLGL